MQGRWRIVAVFGPGPGVARAPALGVVALLSLCLICPALAAPRGHAVHLDLSGRSQVGAASYYSSRITGRRTASGARYAPDRMTAASRTLPLGATARVTNTETGKSATVTVTDRGPFTRGRILDVSPSAARQLGMRAKGVARVKIEPLHLPRPRR